MGELGIKSTIYDVVGYCLPGAFALAFVQIGMSQTLPTFKEIATFKAEMPSVVLLLATSYIIGQVISHLSSLLLENSHIRKWKWYSNLFPVDLTSAKERYSKLYNVPVADVDTRTLIAYCQHHFAGIYETAFVFLSIYGFSRNMFVVVLAMGVCQLLHGDWIAVLTLIPMAVLLFIGYKRFSQYFHKQIASAIFIPKSV